MTNVAEEIKAAIADAGEASNIASYSIEGNTLSVKTKLGHVFDVNMSSGTDAVRRNCYDNEVIIHPKSINGKKPITPPSTVPMEVGYAIKSAGFGFFNVVDPTGKKMNSKRLEKEAAEMLLKELNNL